MYVQWLLEFVWRIFIQGPLMVINFFTNNGNLNKVLGQVFNNDELAKQMTLIISPLILLSAGALILVVLFLVKMAFLYTKSNNEDFKFQVISTVKYFFITLVIMLVTTMFFSLFFMAVNEIFGKISGILNKVQLDQTNIAQSIYKLIVCNDSISVPSNFLFPSSDFLKTMDNMNWLIGILFVNFFAFFIIYMIWSVFQKSLELFFLYATFPVSLGLGMISYEINAKVWLKEILSKLACVFMFVFMIRMYLLMFNSINSLFINRGTLFSNPIEKLIVSFIVTIALGFSMIFIVRMFSYKNKQWVGIIGTVKSFKQTQNFINNTSSIANINSYQTDDSRLKNVNENVDGLKSEISRIQPSINNLYDEMHKVHLFNK